MPTHEQQYATFMIGSRAPVKWATFSGRVLLAGMQMQWTLDQITEYLIEWYQNGDSPPESQEEVTDDMTLSMQPPPLE